MVKIIENLTEFKEGIYISEPLGRLIAEGEKTLIVKKKKFSWENKLKYLVSGDKCYGIIQIKKIYPIDIDKFRELEDRHKVSEIERSRWFPNIQMLFAYDFEIVEKYKEPKKIELPKDVKTDIKNVKFLSKITYEEESKIINENKKKPEASKPHKFKPAEWTHKNGHPRCLICGDEELTEEACKEFNIPKGWCRGIEKEILSEEYSPIGISDDHDKGRAVKWEEVTKYWKKPIKLVEGFIQLIGGVPSHKDGSTGDIDILIRKPEPKGSEDMPVKFRLFRSLPRELGNRLHFVYDKFHGPITDNVKVYDLVLMPIELKVEKMEINDLNQESSKKLRFVIQSHFRGKSEHLDFRFEMNGHLEGWTVDDLVKGVIKEPVLTVEEGKRICSNKQASKIDWDKGETKKLPSGQHMKILTQPKKKHPKDWLKVKGIVPIGEPGSTKQYPGVFIIRDSGWWEEGVRKPDVYEYFIHGNKLKGIYIFIKISTKGLKPREEPLKDSMVWFFWKKAEQVPYMLSSRSLKTKTIPPIGVSWLPKKIENLIPKDLRYWIPNLSMEDRLKRLEGAIDFWKGREIEMSHELDKVKFLKGLEA